MPRKRNQEARRKQLLDAAVAVINEQGPAGVQMKNVAKAANMATGSIYYYYDDVDDLLHQVHHLAYERYVTRRQEAIEPLADPRAQLATMVALGIPRPQDEPLSLALYQVEVAKARDEKHSDFLTDLCSAQREIYRCILDAGAAAGLFHPVAPTNDIAEQLISLEDGYGLGICGGKKDYTYERTHALTVAAAELWTGCGGLAEWLDPSALD